MFKTNSLPNLDKTIRVLEYQRELAFVCQYLLDKNYATRSGKYNSLAQKPLFRDLSKQHNNDIDSMDKKSGEKLLSTPIQKIDDPEAVSKTMRWIVKEFEIVTDKAQKQYKQKLDKQKNYTHIIVAAAHTLSNTKNPKNYFDLMETPEKILFFLGLGLAVLVMAAIYNLFRYEVHWGLVIFNSLSVVFYIISYELEYDKPIKRHPKKEYEIVGLAIFLSIYMFILGKFLVPPPETAYINTYLAAVTTTLFLQIMCFYFALTRLMDIIRQWYRAKTSVIIYRLLIRHKIYIGSFQQIWFLLIASSFMIVLSTHLLWLFRVVFD
jgi:hypothetical protein